MWMTVFRRGTVFIDKPTFSYLKGCALASVDSRKRTIVFEPNDGGLHFTRNPLGGWSSFPSFVIDRLFASDCEQIDFVGKVVDGAVVFRERKEEQGWFTGFVERLIRR